jgi:hypothetical protein
VTLASGRSFRGLSGRDRHALYLTGNVTGFRAQELAALRPDWFALDGDTPTVTLPSEFAKNGRTSV